MAEATKAKLVTAPGALVVSLESEEMQKRIAQCMKETGKVTFGMREVSVTKLGEMTDMAVIVN